MCRRQIKGKQVGDVVISLCDYGQNLLGTESYIIRTLSVPYFIFLSLFSVQVIEILLPHGLHYIIENWVVRTFLWVF